MRKDSYKRVPLKFLLDKQEIYRDIHCNPPDDLLALIFTQIPYLELWSEDALRKLFSGTLDIVGEFCREIIIECNVRLKMESNEITINKLKTSKRKIQNFLRKLVGYQKYVPDMSREKILSSIYNLILSTEGMGLLRNFGMCDKWGDRSSGNPEKDSIYKKHG